MQFCLGYDGPRDWVKKMVYYDLNDSHWFVFSLIYTKMIYIYTNTY